MPRLKLHHAYLDGAKADFVKHSINVRLVLPLNDENLKLRSTLAFLSMEKTSVTVEIESAQLPLFDLDAPPNNETALAESVADEFDSAFKTEFETAATQIYDEPRRRSKLDNGTVTLSAAGHEPVTLTAKQFKAAANADPANLVQKSRIKRMKITKK